MQHHSIFYSCDWFLEYLSMFSNDPNSLEIYNIIKFSISGVFYFCELTNILRMGKITESHSLVTSIHFCRSVTNARYPQTKKILYSFSFVLLHRYTNSLQ